MNAAIAGGKLPPESAIQHGILDLRANKPYFPSIMNHLPTILFSLLLLLVAGVLMLVHWRRWKAFQREELPPAEHDYRRRQFRRRMQASGMIGIVGIALVFGDTFIVWFNDWVVTVVFWAAVLLVTIWIALLAMVDIWATRAYIDRIYENDILEQTKLQAELFRKKQEAIGNNDEARMTNDEGMTKLG
jgi:hypothetical protein